MAQESYAREARGPHSPYGVWGERASFPSLAHCFHPRSRPLIWLLARTWIRKNTDCFTVYLIEDLFSISRNHLPARTRENPQRFSPVFTVYDKSGSDCQQGKDTLTLLKIIRVHDPNPLWNSCLQNRSHFLLGLQDINYHVAWKLWGCLNSRMVLHWFSGAKWGAFWDSGFFRQATIAFNETTILDFCRRRAC